MALSNLWNYLKNNKQDKFAQYAANMQPLAPVQEPLQAIHINEDGSAVPVAVQDERPTRLTLADRLLGQQVNAQDSISLPPSVDSEGNTTIQSTINNNPRRGGILRDIVGGFRENANTGFDFNNIGQNTLDDGRQKGFAYRLGEGLGTVGRIAASPLGRGLITAGLVGATGGNGLEALAYGGQAGIINQQNKMKNALYRRELENNGIDTSNINAYIGDDAFSSMLRAKTLQDNAEYRKMYFENQKQAQEEARQDRALQRELTRRGQDLSYSTSMANIGLQREKMNRALEGAGLSNADRKTLNENMSTLSDIQAGLDLIEKNPNAYSLVKGVLPAWATNRIDPKGISTRTQIDNITAVYRKWLTGAQMSDQERKAYERFLPAPTDNYQTVKAKLQGMYDSIQRKNDVIMQGANFNQVADTNPLGLELQRLKMADYIEFSRQIKEKYPQYKDVDDLKLAQAMVNKYPQYKDQVTFEIEQPQQEKPKGIDLTPSGLVKQATAGLAAPLRAARFKETLPEAYNRAREIQENSALNKLSPAVDIAAGFALPEVKAVQGAGLLPRLANYALTGAEQGAVYGGLGGLKENGLRGLLPGVGEGAVAGGLIGGGLPLVGNAAKQAVKLLPMAGGLVARTVGRIQPETLQRAVNPNSKALDLSRDQAQNLLMNTTERVRNTYNNLLDQAGQKVSEATQNLPKNYFVPKEYLQNSLDDIYGSYSVSGDKALNVARNEAGKVYNSVNDLIESAADTQGVVPARELKDILNNISAKTQWDKPGAQLQNEILERLYGDYSRKLGTLSPELAEANKVYSQLKDFEKNEGIRRILRPGDNIDAASSALRNYNSTVTKGNTGRNIQDLEKIITDSGAEPFINDIDDVNAAMDLLNQRTTGDSWLANMATQLTRPALKAVREFNRRGLSQYFNNAGRQVPRYLTPILYGAPRLYGGISND